MCQCITDIIENNNMLSLIKTGKQFKEAENSVNDSAYYLERGKDNGEVIHTVHRVAISKSIVFPSVRFCTQVKMEYHFLHENTQCGVVLYKAEWKSLPSRMLLSSGPLTGCIFCVLVFTNCVIFIHEGGSNKSQNKEDNLRVNRFRDIFNAISLSLGSQSIIKDKFADETDDVIAFIDKLEPFKFLYGGIMLPVKDYVKPNRIYKDKNCVIVDYQPIGLDDPTKLDYGQVLFLKNYNYATIGLSKGYPSKDCNKQNVEFSGPMRGVIMSCGEFGCSNAVVIK